MTYRFYGDTELSPLPWYDKEVTPYSIIFHYVDESKQIDTIAALCSSEKFSCNSTLIVYPTMNYYAFLLDDDKWNPAEISNSTGTAC